MIVLDTSGLLAAIDASQRHHAAAAAALRASDGPLLLSPFVLAELDYLLSTRVSSRAATSLLGQVADGAYRLEPMAAEDIARATEIIGRYRDLELGLADASLVVLAERHGIHDVLTLDERHFRAIDGPGGRPFRILPADA
ncbi:MAG TPA: PIN domain-containing protein [Candidatus Limnocylindrales bacterium]|nr:PIN domain-containing protein [Candidatus Limnocylindrales bacterium]